MKIIAEFPQEIFEQHDVRIPLTDGSELSARIWRPTSPEPVPAIVEYIPYRQRDLTAVRDSIHHPYIAGHGYACIRVDLRGSGDSDGSRGRVSGAGAAGRRGRARMESPASRGVPGGPA